MNFLARVKLSNNYDLILNNLSHETGTPPITDVEGTTALLLDDGTSWEFLDGDWQQIDIPTDTIILNSFYSFLSSICNSIENEFINCNLSAFYEQAVIELNENKSFTISSLEVAPKVQSEDFVLVKTATESVLTKVVSTSATSVTIDGTGLSMRVTGAAEVVGIMFVSFPPDFMDAAINMLGYDMFMREDKEKRQERLGNYTYTNFEPTQYYGAGEYPINLQNKIKFWQNIHV